MTGSKQIWVVWWSTALEVDQGKTVECWVKNTPWAVEFWAERSKMSNWAYSLESSIALHKNNRLYFSIPDSPNVPKILYWRWICSPRPQQCCLGNPQGILRSRTIFSSGQRRGNLLELNISNKTYRVYVAIQISVSSGSLVTEGWR